MFRAASTSTERIWPASGPDTPVTVTRLTATSEESRSHTHPPPSNKSAASTDAISLTRSRTRPFATIMRAPSRSSWPAPLGRELDRSERLDLGLELDAKPLLDPAAPLGHDRDYVGGRRVAMVLDEVGVLGGEPGAPDAQPPAAGGVEQLPGGAVLRPRVLGVLEGRSERLDPRRLGGLPARSHVGERRLDLVAHGFGEGE